jgi:hypothetical protein
MKIKLKGKPPVPEPEPVFSITGLTVDEMYFLRDVMGRFADNPGDGGIKVHFHTTLYREIVKALKEGGVRSAAERVFNITAWNNCLHCTRIGR